MGRDTKVFTLQKREMWNITICADARERRSERDRRGLWQLYVRQKPVKTLKASVAHTVPLSRARTACRVTGQVSGALGAIV